MLIVVLVGHLILGVARMLMPASVACVPAACTVSAAVAEMHEEHACDEHDPDPIAAQDLHIVHLLVRDARGHLGSRSVYSSTLRRAGGDPVRARSRFDQVRLVT